MEEIEDGEKSYVTDSCLDEEEEHVGSFDENSLAFERDLDNHPEEGEVWMEDTLSKGSFLSKPLGDLIYLKNHWPENLTKIWILVFTCKFLVENVNKMALFNVQLYSIYLYFIHIKY